MITRLNSLRPTIQSSVARVEIRVGAFYWVERQRHTSHRTCSASSVRPDRNGRQETIPYHPETSSFENEIKIYASSNKNSQFPCQHLSIPMAITKSIFAAIRLFDHLVSILINSSREYHLPALI